MNKRPKPSAPAPEKSRVSLAVLNDLAPRLLAPLCIRFSEEQRLRLHKAAFQVGRERGMAIEDSTLARELVMRGVSKLID